VSNKGITANSKIQLKLLDRGGPIDSPLTRGTGVAPAELLELGCPRPGLYRRCDAELLRSDPLAAEPFVVEAVAGETRAWMIASGRRGTSRARGEATAGKLAQALCADAF
jgi:hypothetical protein